MSLCPCGTQKEYADCCGPFIEGKAVPETPEQLMRSRYTAFTQANAEYIGKTMRKDALAGYSPIDTKQWAMSVKWRGLEILEANEINENDTVSFVTFIARFISDNMPNQIHETAEFHKIDGRWYYCKEHIPESLLYQGNHEPIRNTNKIGRNDPCLCGSGKKFKKCCA